MIVTGFVVIGINDAISAETHCARDVLARVIADDAFGEAIITNFGVRRTVITGFVTCGHRVPTDSGTDRGFSITDIASLDGACCTTSIVSVVVLIVTSFVVISINDAIPAETHCTSDVLARVIADDAFGEAIITNFGVRRTVITGFVTCGHRVPTDSGTDRGFSITDIASLDGACCTTSIVSVIVLIVTSFVVISINDAISAETHCARDVLA